MVVTASTKMIAPPMIEPQGEDDLQGHDAQSRDDSDPLDAPAIEAVEAQRGQVAAVAGLRSGCEVGADVDGVQNEEDDGGGTAAPGPLERREGDGDGDAVGQQEVPHILADDDWLDVHARSPVRRRGPAGKDRATGHRTWPASRA